MLHINHHASLTAAGWLHLDLRPALPVKLRIAPWVKGLRVYSRNPDTNHPWEPLTEDPGLLLIDARPCPEVERFVAPMPADLRRLIEPFGYRQIPMLQWLARLPEARSLFRANPVLFWLVADHALRVHWSPERFGQALRRPQPALLDEVAGVGSRAAVRFLRKVEPVLGDRWELEAVLRTLVGTDIVHACRHLDCVPTELVQLIDFCPSLYRYPRLLVHLRRHRARSWPNLPVSGIAEHLSVLLHDTEQLGRWLGINDRVRAIDRCKTPEALQRLHDRWTERFNRSLDISLPNQAVPKPPLPDSPTIRAIRDTDGLMAEGRSMRHCVGSYASQVLCRELAVYRVPAPERGTLALSHSHGRIEIHEFTLAGNANPSPASNEGGLAGATAHFGVCMR